MEFKKIAISNFKNIEALVYEPKNKVLAVTGPNGKGKTSFKEALFAALTGVFPDNAIMEGKDECVIQLTLPDDTVISRHIHRTDPNFVMVGKKKVTAKSVMELIESKTGINKDTFRIISSGENIEKLSSAELGTLMLEAIPEKLDINKLLKYAGKMDSEVKSEFIKLFPALPEEFSMSEVNQAYDSAFEQRKFLKKIAANHKAKIDTFMSEEPEEKLEDIKKRLENILKQEAVVNEKKAIYNLYIAALKNRENAEKNIANLKRQLSEISATRPNEAELASIESEISAVNKALINAKSIINTLTENTMMFQNTLANIDKTVCPLSERLICTTDKTKVKEDLEELIESNKEGIEIQKKIITESEEKLSVLKKKRQEFEENRRQYQQKVLLNSQIEQAESMLPNVPEKPDMNRDEDFSAEKSYLKSLQEAGKAWQQHLIDVSEYEKTSQKVKVFDAICKLLEPKGLVITNIMEYYLKIFEGVFNSRANELKPGFEIKFIPVDGVSYRIKTSATSPFKLFDSLSSGEKQLVSFLFIDMFNSLSQQKIMMLDDIDKLDSESFEQLIKLIMTPAVQDSYDNILVVGVNHKDVEDTLAKYAGSIDTI